MFSLWSADTSKGTATDRNAPWEFLYFLDDVTSLAEWKKSEKKNSFCTEINRLYRNFMGKYAKKSEVSFFVSKTDATAMRYEGIGKV